MKIHAEGRSFLLETAEGVKLEQPNIYLQPKSFVTPTTTCCICGYPPCFALRRGLPRALGVKAAMIFQRENCKPISAPTVLQIARELSLTKSRGKSSFASLTAHDGSYIQVAGGPGIFMLEFRNSFGLHHRATQQEPVVPFADNTLLSFSGGSINLARGEWFQLKQVAEVLSCFLASKEFPKWLIWQPLDGNLVQVAQKSAQIGRAEDGTLVS